MHHAAVYAHSLAANCAAAVLVNACSCAMCGNHALWSMAVGSKKFLRSCCWCWLDVGVAYTDSYNLAVPPTCGPLELGVEVLYIYAAASCTHC